MIIQIMQDAACAENQDVLKKTAIIIVLIVIQRSQNMTKRIIGTECKNPKCFKTIELRESHFRGHGYHYCSRSCQTKHHNEINTIFFNCQECGKEHKTMRHFYNRSLNHFCSKKCASIYREKNTLSEKKVKNKPKRTGRYCIKCGEPIYKREDESIILCRFCTVAKARKGNLYWDEMDPYGYDLKICDNEFYSIGNIDVS